MDLPLEEILGTLFSGGLGVFGFCLLIFILTGSAGVATVTFVFRKLFYQSKFNGLAANQPTAEVPVGSSDVAKWFIGLICVAAIYVVGISLEYSSDCLTDNDQYAVFTLPCRPVPGDKVIRGLSFARIYDPRYHNYAPNDELGTLATNLGPCNKDYRTYKRGNGLTNCENWIAQASKDWSQIHFIPILGSNYSLSDACKNYLSKAGEKYYQAKNTVFSDSNYYNELKSIERRIDFLRSNILIGLGFSWLFVLAIVLKAISLLPAPRRHVLRFFARHWRHWRMFSPSKIVILMVLAIIFWMNMASAWFQEELEFDNRAFGYFLDHFSGKTGSESARDKQLEYSVGLFGENAVKEKTGGNGMPPAPADSPAN